MLSPHTEPETINSRFDHFATRFSRSSMHTEDPLPQRSAKVLIRYLTSETIHDTYCPANREKRLPTAASSPHSSSLCPPRPQRLNDFWLFSEAAHERVFACVARGSGLAAPDSCLHAESAFRD